MKLENFLNYTTHNSETIIQWLFLAILALSGILIARYLFAPASEGSEAKASASSSESTATVAPSPELQEALNKILEQTAKLETVNVKQMSPEVVLQTEAQIQALKRDLEEREAEIKTLKDAGTSQPSEDAAKLAARIAELEGKLAEYEILEDDIADLSLYKEENTRLRSEVERLKGGAPAAAPAAEAAPAAVTENPDAIVNEFAQAVGETPAAPAPESIKMPESDDPMKDFEATVQMEKSLQSGAAAPAEAAPESAPAPENVVAMPTSEPAAAAPVATEADDLFAEFSKPADLDVEKDEGLDTERMMAEMAQLVNLEPAKGSALEESIDTDKMVLEASGLTKS